MQPSGADCRAMVPTRIGFLFFHGLCTTRWRAGVCTEGTFRVARGPRAEPIAFMSNRGYCFWDVVEGMVRSMVELDSRCVFITRPMRPVRRRFCPPPDCAPTRSIDRRVRLGGGPSWGPRLHVRSRRRLAASAGSAPSAWRGPALRARAASFSRPARWPRATWPSSLQSARMEKHTIAVSARARQLTACTESYRRRPGSGCPCRCKR